VVTWWPHHSSTKLGTNGRYVIRAADWPSEPSAAGFGMRRHSTARSERQQPVFLSHPNFLTKCPLLAHDLTDVERPTPRGHDQAGEGGRDDASGPFPCPGIAGSDSFPLRENDARWTN
jgi:hypothetical protein